MAVKVASIFQLLSFTIPFIVPTIFAQRSNTCFVLNGRRPAIAGFRCDNSTDGASACCGTGSTCYSNGLCQQQNGQVVDYLRVGCTDPTWQDPACLNQCAAFAPGSAAGVRFCNGPITNSTSYCCDDGSQGVGSFHCCDSPRSIFRISPAATILAQMPLSQLATSTTSSSSTSQTSTSATTAITSAPATSSSAPPPNDGDSSTKAAAIGAGVGVPVVVVALGLVGFFLWRRRRNAKRNQAFELQNNEANDGPPYHDHNGVPQPVEADGLPMQKGRFGGSAYQLAPQELPARNQVHELGS
ncbi:hypothetical protein VTL71DRAFT_5289 [Oculimacula yallundae]|uniref:Mid2 domain-containing protein n=1 Tax=Oculimacula yallundae TaxID=86028 RepID=A0ABR4C2B5_9HELO